MRGRFIAFEGIDGSGKSSLLKEISGDLRSKGLEVVETREPGGTPLAERVRELLVGDLSHLDPPAPLTELLLYMASRCQHAVSKIAPALDRGAWVLSDRYSASSVAFQSAGRAIDLETVVQLNRLVTAQAKPDLQVLLDVSVEVARERMRASERKLDRIEAMDLDFHKRVRDSYLRQSQEHFENWLVLDSERLSPIELSKALTTELVRRGFVS